MPWHLAGWTEWRRQGPNTVPAPTDPSNISPNLSGLRVQVREDRRGRSSESPFSGTDSMARPKRAFLGVR